MSRQFSITLALKPLNKDEVPNQRIQTFKQSKKEPVNSDSFHLLTPLSQSLGTAGKARWNSVVRANVRTSP